MPEGVEVKLSCDLIKPMIQDHLILDSYSTSNSRYGGRSPEGHLRFMISLKQGNVRVKDIKTKGKFMYWTFSNGQYMFCTFGMTGQWSKIQGKHPCFVFRHAVDTQSEIQELVFNDPRHFGTIKFSGNRDDLLHKLDELGWDPLNNDFDSIYQNYLVNQIRIKKKCIGEILMDQSVFAGVGNYIRAEALYASKISPWRTCNQLSREEILLLCHNLIDVMKESYSYQGATILTYKDAYGAEGRYSSCFKVYGQEKDPLGNKIIKETTPEGRTIHWCPNIQK